MLQIVPNQFPDPTVPAAARASPNSGNLSPKRKDFDLLIIGVRWGAARPPPNGASFPPVRARRGGRIRGQGFFVRPSVRSSVRIFSDFIEFLSINLMEFQCFFYAAFRFPPKKAIFAILGQKVRKFAFWRTFAPRNALSRLFRSKTRKRARARNLALANAFFSYFGSHFRKKAEKGGFFAFWEVWATFGSQNLLLRPKSEKAQQRAEDEKASISLRAQNSGNHKVLGTFLEPKTPKSAFSTFWPTFPFWSVFGAKSAPEAKN